MTILHPMSEAKRDGTKILATISAGKGALSGQKIVVRHVHHEELGSVWAMETPQGDTYFKDSWLCGWSSLAGAKPHRIDLSDGSVFVCHDYGCEAQGHAGCLICAADQKRFAQKKDETEDLRDRVGHITNQEAPDTADKIEAQQVTIDATQKELKALRLLFADMWESWLDQDEIDLIMFEKQAEEHGLIRKAAFDPEKHEERIRRSLLTDAGGRGLLLDAGDETLDLTEIGAAAVIGARKELKP